MSGGMVIFADVKDTQQMLFAMDLALFLIIGGVALYAICLVGGWHERRRERKKDSRNWTAEEWQQFLEERQKELDKLSEN